jgi:hypothetical protein
MQLCASEHLYYLRSFVSSTLSTGCHGDESLQGALIMSLYLLDEDYL